MRKLTYLAVFEPTDTGYSVYFPDLPGCISVGENFKDAQKQAEDALSLHIYGMEKDGEEVPEPSDDLQIDSQTESGHIVALITTFPDLVKNEIDNKKVPTNVTIPAWIKARAEERKINYSLVLQTALKEILGISEQGK